MYGLFDSLGFLRLLVYTFATSASILYLRERENVVTVLSVALKAVRLRNTEHFQDLCAGWIFYCVQCLWLTAIQPVLREEEHQFCLASQSAMPKKARYDNQC